MRFTMGTANANNKGFIVVLCCLVLVAFGLVLQMQEERTLRQAMTTTTAAVPTLRAGTASIDGEETPMFEEVWDEAINVTEEKERCARYGFQYDGRSTRRRVFLGSLLADDTWHPLQAVAAEGYGIYDTVSYIESNSTQSRYPRKLRFTEGSEALTRLKGLFGPLTKVFVDTVMMDRVEGGGLTYEDVQREYILYRWKLSGMQPEDIGIIADTDETFTRDFLRAVQICDVPQFRPGQDCSSSRIMAAAMVFESSPDCITKERLWYHPDMSIGECILHVGDEKIHKPVPKYVDWEKNGVGDRFDWDILQQRATAKEPFPLLHTPDIRMAKGGSTQYRLKGTEAKQEAQKTGQPVGYTGYHFHNFFDNATTLRNKMSTYGHPDSKAWNRTLGDLHGDVLLGINCVMGRNDTGRHDSVTEHVVGGLSAIVGPIPVFFQNETYRRERHEQYRKIVEEDEAKYGRPDN